MFQSSLMSWSSQTIEVETVEKQPADQRVLPGLAVEPGVLLEVDHLLARRVSWCRGARGSSPAPRASPRRRRPGRRAGRAAPASCRGRRALICRGQHPQRVELMAVLVAVLAEGVGLLVREGNPAGAEADVEGLAGCEGADRARRQVCDRGEASSARRLARPRTRRSCRAPGSRCGPGRSDDLRPRTSARDGRALRPRRRSLVSTQIVASVSET